MEEKALTNDISTRAKVNKISDTGLIAKYYNNCQVFIVNFRLYVYKSTDKKKSKAVRSLIGE